MKKQEHTLTDREMDENGLCDKYEEFNDIDFSNEFVPLERPDIEIRASKKNKQSLKEDDMKNSRKASYIGELSSGYDATVENDYEAGKGDVGQIGKGHEEEVAANDNWKNDKRDAIGRAASISSALKRTAANLSKIAEMLDESDEDFEDIDDLDLDDECDVVKEASHPIEHDSKKDDPAANMSSQTGDDEWIDIGPGEFDDKRDDANRAE